MTPQEQQLVEVIDDGSRHKIEADRAIGDVVSACNRMNGIRELLKNAALVLTGGDPDLVAVQAAAEEEARYWSREYARATPIMIRERAALQQAQAKVDALQAEIRVRQRELEAERKGAVGNPPGAAPSIGLTS